MYFMILYLTLSDNMLATFKSFGNCLVEQILEGGDEQSTDSGNGFYYQKVAQSEPVSGIQPLHTCQSARS